jgi:glycosyltransferase involved in cell wall biosynthesis
MPAVAPGAGPEPILHSVSLVVPVYQGERTLDALADEAARLTGEQRTPGGRRWAVSELVLVHDGARDRSADVMEALAARHPFVRVVWLSRNFGQHPATLAGMASTVSPWVATLDEDGQQDPQDVGRLLDAALDAEVRLVYARPSEPPHGALRNGSSALAKWLFTHALGNRLGAFNSFRLMEGEVARAVAAYCGANVYLDVALSWVVDRAAHCAVSARAERGRPSGYGLFRLLRHFWQLVLTSGTRPLRLISLAGAAALVGGVAATAWVLYGRFRHQVPVQGWTSMVVALCLFGGLVLLSLGVIAEYLGIAVSMAMGKPPYLIVGRPRPSRTP